MTYNPKAIGERSEAIIAAHYLMRGDVVLHPFGDNQRYDLVVENDGKFRRIQCKTGKLDGDVIRFSTASCAGGKVKKDYVGQIEAFAVYCPQNQKVYEVPIEAAPSRSMMLRLASPKNNSAVSTVNWASDYEI